MQSVLLCLLLAAAGSALAQKDGEFRNVLALLETKDAIDEPIGQRTAELLQLSADVKVRTVSTFISGETLNLAFGRRVDGPEEYFFVRREGRAGERRVYRTDAQLRLLAAAVWSEGKGRPIAPADAERELKRQINLWIDIVRYQPGATRR